LSTVFAKKYKFPEIIFIIRKSFRSRTIIGHLPRQQKTALAGGHANSALKNLFKKIFASRKQSYAERLALSQKNYV
jgi:hypothetical protein